MKILLIDDSPLARAITTDFLKDLSYVETIDTARNGKIGLELIQKNHYDLIFLDVAMPVMDGITFLSEKKKLGNNIPTIMFSAYTKEGAEITLKALELGAIDFILKPEGSVIKIDDIKQDLIDKIKNFITDYIESRQKKSQSKEIVETKKIENETPTKTLKKKKLIEYEIVLIGSSTGGPRVLNKIVRMLPENFPLPVAIVQHMPEYFTSTLAERLSQFCKLEVKEAKDDYILEPGKVVVAKGNKHLLFKKLDHKKFSVILSDDKKINAVRPSMDKTLFNLIEITNGNVISIILTGMGRDGVDACKQLKKHNGLVIAQDEETSIIFGMNKRAIEENAVDIVLPDYKIVDYLLKLNEI